MKILSHSVLLWLKLKKKLNTCALNSLISVFFCENIIEYYSVVNISLEKMLYIKILMRKYYFRKSMIEVDRALNYF